MIRQYSNFIFFFFIFTLLFKQYISIFGIDLNEKYEIINGRGNIVFIDKI